LRKCVPDPLGDLGVSQVARGQGHQNKG
jgi:hypothetical protein